MAAAIWKSLSPELPVLIAGATASGKSGLALEIAEIQGGVIINADALQVFSNWRVLTARPSYEEEARAEHALYGHVAGTFPYSVGHWLREVAPLINGNARPIIVGGTGLYFQALTHGLVDIPLTPPEVRAEADEIVISQGFESLLNDLDAATVQKIDTLNPMRVQRAWEVQKTTGRGLAAWQDETPDPILPLHAAQSLLLDADKDWLNARIDQRFDLMIKNGALEEAKLNLPSWNPNDPSAKAIGAAELIDYLQGNRDLNAAVETGKLATRQYAKRQRTWFRSKMSKWRSILLS